MKRGHYLRSSALGGASLGAGEGAAHTAPGYAVLRKLSMLPDSTEADRYSVVTGMQSTAMSVWPDPTVTVESGLCYRALRSD